MAPINNEEALLQLIEDNRRIIYKICHVYCKNKQDQEDLQQEIVYQLWRSYPNYDPKYKFTTWMYRVALNIAISFYRKTKTGSDIVSLEEEHTEVAEEQTDVAAKETTINSLYQFINGLKELDKALMLLYLEEKSYAEIADILGISETNVATKISRTKEKLKQHFTV
jgi:RNA polymerase sigma-70 factor (ECF subfamily)